MCALKLTQPTPSSGRRVGWKKQKTKHEPVFGWNITKIHKKYQRKKENDEVTTDKKGSLLDPLREVHIPQLL